MIIRRHAVLVRLATIALVASSVAGSRAVAAADHDDTPELRQVARHDARLTDLHVFSGTSGLVVALSTNPTILPDQTTYRFPSDLSFRINIDNQSDVRFDNPNDVATFGGTIANPDEIQGRIKIDVRFSPNGTPRFTCDGSCDDDTIVRTFAGLRDDPFIRGPRTGRNVAAVVVELSWKRVLKGSSTVLVWATSKVPDVLGPISEHAGRALRSQFAENLNLNAYSPRDQYEILGQRPDVVIYDRSRPARFPNGRALEDDVVDLVGDGRVLSNDAPFPSTNDVPFLSAFPYLAPPHAP